MPIAHLCSRDCTYPWWFLALKDRIVAERIAGPGTAKEELPRSLKRKRDENDAERRNRFERCDLFLRSARCSGETALLSSKHAGIDCASTLVSRISSNHLACLSHRSPSTLPIKRSHSTSDSWRRVNRRLRQLTGASTGGLGIVAKPQFPSFEHGRQGFMVPSASRVGLAGPKPRSECLFRGFGFGFVFYPRIITSWWKDYDCARCQYPSAPVSLRSYSFVPYLPWPSRLVPVRTRGPGLAQHAAPTYAHQVPVGLLQLQAPKSQGMRLSSAPMMAFPRCHCPIWLGRGCGI